MTQKMSVFFRVFRGRTLFGGPNDNRPDSWRTAAGRAASAADLADGAGLPAVGGVGLAGVDHHADAAGGQPRAGSADHRGDLRGATPRVCQLPAGSPARLALQPPVLRDRVR